MNALDPETRDAIRAAGRDPDAAERQLDVLRGDKPFTRIVRPATVGDGIRQLDDAEAARLEASHAAAARAGRIGVFVPASGAASRMFKAFVQAWQAGIADAEAEGVDPKVRDVIAHATDLAMWPALEEAGAREGDAASILEAMFGALEVHRLPKGLVPFHPHPRGPRTAFFEHLAESAKIAQDDDGTVRCHFTVGEQHRARFQVALAEARKTLEPALGVTFEVTFSVQDPATDTVALAKDGTLFRKDDGTVLFRPGGHGALLKNLAATGGDVVLVKNIDNVVPEDLRAPLIPWRERLSGLLVELQATAHALVVSLRDGDRLAEARAFLSETLGIDGGSMDAAAIARLLDRPWRVCGMVKNEGQPGGGPFWAESPDGVTLQIVEGAQIDQDDADQREILAGSTHFNPVDMALGLRDADGRPHDLSRYIDPDAVITTGKSFEGRELMAIEHPGLWNGGMARWCTVFVEVPATTFEPVKTLADLLSSEHGGPIV